MPITCLRCKRVLDESEKTCRECNSSDVKKNQSKESVGNEDTNKNDRKLDFFGIFSLLFLGAFLLAAFFEFLNELKGTDIFTAIRKNPIPLIAGMAFIYIMILSSRNRLERAGFGMLHKVVKYATILVVAYFLFIIIFSFIGVPEIKNLPDNVRL